MNYQKNHSINHQSIKVLIGARSEYVKIKENRNFLEPNIEHKIISLEFGQYSIGFYNELKLM